MRVGRMRDVTLSHANRGENGSNGETTPNRWTPPHAELHVPGFGRSWQSVERRSCCSSM